ncbi:hypothetical protein EsH8_VII_000130 [Colletotrichum jinshuiense]
MSFVDRSFVTIAFGHRRRLIAHPHSYNSLIRKARATFNLTGENMVIYYTGDEADGEVELDRNAFKAVSDGCILRFVIPNLKVFVKTVTGMTIDLVSFPSATILDLKQALYLKEQIPSKEQRLIYKGITLEDEHTLNDYHIQNNDIIHLRLNLSGGKPAIYLMSPFPLMKVAVHVTLSHHWNFSTIYPLADPVIGLDNESTVSWKVSVGSDGILKDTATGVQCSYLFWEAETLANTDACASPSPTYSFDPRVPRLHLAGNVAVVLPFSDFIPYLDRALTTLTLTPAMRTEFIVYWLPKFQKIRDRGRDIAFNFVPQAAFKKVARLDVSPQPKTVARVFLVFEASHDGIGGPTDIAELDAIDWPARVGIDVAGMKDKSAFRVMEWGGMDASMD